LNHLWCLDDFVGYFLRNHDAKLTAADHFEELAASNRKIGPGSTAGNTRAGGADAADLRVRMAVTCCFGEQVGRVGTLKY